MGRSVLILVCLAAFGCTPIGEVNRSASSHAPFGTQQPDASADASSSAASAQVASGTVVEPATPCSDEGARACEGHGVRELSICKDGAWTTDTPCKVDERCDSLRGECAPIAAVCVGQQAGAVFCDGDKRLVCDDLVVERELPCAANELCSRKDGQVSCACAPGAAPSKQGQGCEAVSGCDDDGSGCDPLTECISNDASQRACTECPSGFAGSGTQGCLPLLETLSVSCGPGATPLSVALVPGTYQYRVRLPVVCQRATLTATWPASTQLEVEGATVEAGSAWVSPALRIGDNAHKLVLTAVASGRSSSYQLSVERAGATCDYLKASNAGANDGFGFAMAAVGTTLLVGAPYEYGDGSSPENNSRRDAGAAYVFELQGDKWVETQLLKAPMPIENGFFGSTVAIAGDILVVGEPRFNKALFKVISPTEPGTAHVFVRQGTSWRHEAQLKPPDGAGADMFGFHVAVHAETILVGAPYDSTAGARTGAVYSFVRNQGRWERQQKVVVSAPVADSSLGTSIALEGDLMVAGAMQDPTPEEAAGSAYVFARNGGMWVEEQRLQAPMPKALATFGLATAIHSGRILVTAAGLDLRQRSTPAGEAFVYQRTGGSNPWQVTAQLRAATPRGVDLFGAAAAFNGTTLVIGANGDASLTNEIDGDPSRIDADFVGAAYVFDLDDSAYKQSAYVKAFNAGAESSYGHSVALTDTFLAVSAPYEASNQRGISDQDSPNAHNTSAPASGAVYVYR